MPKKIEPTKKTELAVVDQAIPGTIELSSERFVTPAVLDMFDRMAPVLARSRLMGVMRTEEAYAIMLKGYEIGLSITASFEFVQVIQGKPSLTPRGAMALLLSSKSMKDIQIIRLTDKDKFVGYECIMTRDTGFTHTARFTMADAERAGLVKPDSGWAKYPENMCMWRAVGFAADVVAPDITAGMTTLMKMPEAFGVSLTAEGNVINATAEPMPLSSLNELLTQFPPDAIMTANDGRIPSTQEEIDAVRAKLTSNA
jgi:hypothetical protein